MKSKKLFLVKREVKAYTIQQAMNGKGRIYEIVECEKIPEEDKNKKVGFNNNKNNKKTNAI